MCLSCRPLAVSSKAQEHRLVQGSAARPDRSSGRSRAGSLGFPSRRWPTGRKECAAIGSERRFASGTCTQWHGTGSHACTRRAVLRTEALVHCSAARHTSSSVSNFSSMGGVCGVRLRGVALARFVGRSGDIQRKLTPLDGCCARRERRQKERWITWRSPS